MVIPLDKDASLKRQHLGQCPNNKDVLFEKVSEVGWSVRKRVRGHRLRGQPLGSHVAGMNLVCSRNEKEARVNGAKWTKGRVLVHDISRLAGDRPWRQIRPG